MFNRKKPGLLSKALPILAIAGMAQSFMKRRGRKSGTLSKLIGTAGLAALAMQKASSQRAGRWY